MFATDPADKHQHQTGSPDQQGSGKIRRCNQQTNHCYRKDHRQKSFFKILYLVLFSAEQTADIHDQRKLGEIGGLKSHVDDRKAYPPASFIQFHAEE